MAAVGQAAVPMGRAPAVQVVNNVNPAKRFKRDLLDYYKDTVKNKRGELDWLDIVQFGNNVDAPGLTMGPAWQVLVSLQCTPSRMKPVWVDIPAVGQLGAITSNSAFSADDWERLMENRWRKTLSVGLHASSLSDRRFKTVKAFSEMINMFVSNQITLTDVDCESLYRRSESLDNNDLARAIMKFAQNPDRAALDQFARDMGDLEMLSQRKKKTTRGSRKNNPIKCFKCGKQGHFQSQCNMNVKKENVNQSQVNHFKNEERDY